MKVSKVLLVDDEADIRRIGELSLKAVGKLQVFLAKSGFEALEMAKRENPDVVLLDVMMPGMDGPTTLERLRCDVDLAQIPVIFMTAKVQRQEVETYSKLGALGVISKPFDPMTLPKQLFSIIDSPSEVFAR